MFILEYLRFEYEIRKYCLHKITTLNQKYKFNRKTKKYEQEINKIIKEKGEQAAVECGVFNLDPRILAILGRLYFRTSYGQNVLQHSIEMTHIAGMIAQELGADVAVAAATGSRYRRGDRDEGRMRSRCRPRHRSGRPRSAAGWRLECC